MSLNTKKYVYQSNDSKTIEKDQTNKFSQLS